MTILDRLAEHAAERVAISKKKVPLSDLKAFAETVKDPGSRRQN